jgi:hypothetical protein
VNEEFLRFTQFLQSNVTYLKPAATSCFKIIDNSSLAQPYNHPTLHNISSWKAVAKYPNNYQPIVGMAGAGLNIAPCGKKFYPPPLRV